MQRLKESEVKEILRYKEEKIKAIHQRIESLYVELKNSENICFPTISSPKLDMILGCGKSQDLSDLLIQYEERKQKHEIEIRELIFELVKMEEKINRVWACFHALPEPHYTILNELYVKNQLYETVERNSAVSHKTFENQRKRGILTIIDFFESSKSVAELMRESSFPKKPEQRQEKIRNSNYHQISFDDILITKNQ